MNKSSAGLCFVTSGYILIYNQPIKRLFTKIKYRNVKQKSTVHEAYKISNNKKQLNK